MISPSINFNGFLCLLWHFLCQNWQFYEVCNHWGCVIPYYLIILPPRQKKKLARKCQSSKGFLGQKDIFSRQKSCGVFPRRSAQLQNEGPFFGDGEIFLSKGSSGWEIPKCQNSGFRRHGEIGARFYTQTSTLTSFQEPRASDNAHLQTLTDTPELQCYIVGFSLRPPKCFCNPNFFLKMFTGPKTCLNKKLVFWFGGLKQKKT